MESKKPWLSRTILVGALSAILGGVAMLLPAAKPMLDWMNSHGAEIAMGWGMIAMVLRMVTKGKISLEE